MSTLHNYYLLKIKTFLIWFHYHSLSSPRSILIITRFRTTTMIADLTAKMKLQRFRDRTCAFARHWFRDSRSLHPLPLPALPYPPAVPFSVHLPGSPLLRNKGFVRRDISYKQSHELWGVRASTTPQLSGTGSGQGHSWESLSQIIIGLFIG